MGKVSNTIVVKILKSPFFIMTVLFAIWMLFFDGNGFFNQKAQKEKAEALKKQGEFYENEVVKLENNIKSIEQDPEALEKFARENYMYKKRGEEIYIVEDEKKKE